MFAKDDSSNRQKIDGCSYASFSHHGKMSLGFCLKRAKRFFLEVLFYNQQKDTGLL